MHARRRILSLAGWLMLAYRMRMLGTPERLAVEIASQRTLSGTLAAHGARIAL
jgi:hypothetical protein